MLLLRSMTMWYVSLNTHTLISVPGADRKQLSQLWTLLGGNRSVLGRYESQLALLNDLAGYRGKAMAHVRVSLMRLEKMQTDLEDLRDHMARPGVLAEAGMEGLPLEVQMDTIRRGVERLKNSMEKARGVTDR